MKTPHAFLLSCLTLWLTSVGSEAQLNLPWEKETPAKPTTVPAKPAAPTPTPVKPPAPVAQPDSDGPPSRITAPDGSSSVRMLQQAMPGTDGVTGFFTLEVLLGARVVARVPTEGYLISAHWSPDNRQLAVNNRRGNNGDYLWIFSLPDGATLKKPDDTHGDRWFSTAKKEIQTKFKTAKADSVYKSWLTASGWSAGGELQLNLRIRYSGSGVGTFDYMAPVQFQNGKWLLRPGTIQAVP